MILLFHISVLWPRLCRAEKKPIQINAENKTPREKKQQKMLMFVVRRVKERIKAKECRRARRKREKNNTKAEPKNYKRVNDSTNNEQQIDI